MRMQLRIIAVITTAAFILTFAVSGCDETTSTPGTGFSPDVSAAFESSAGLPGRGAVPSTPTADMLSAAAGVNGFAVDVYAQLASGEDGNMFISPVSISTALAMTYAGAAGQTAAQMETALRFPLTGDDLHDAFGNLDGFLQSDSDGLRLSTANALWGQENFPFANAFLARVKGSYDAPLGELDFMNDPDGSRRIINRWVEQKTNDRIRDLIPNGVISWYTVLVLTNAIYFLCNWANPFDEDDSFPGTFRLAEGGSVDADMMEKEGEYFNYADMGDYKVLEMPYKDNRYSMVIFLPDDDDGITSLQAGFTKSVYDTAIAALDNTEIDLLNIPRFEMTCEFDLVEPLVNLGMVDAFDAFSADFSGITGSANDLYISAVLHKAFIKVNEKGTEAAAATAVVIDYTGAPVNNVEFVADHPFMFVICDVQTGAILFMGRVMDPSATE